MNLEPFSSAFNIIVIVISSLKSVKRDIFKIKFLNSHPLKD